MGHTITLLTADEERTADNEGWGVFEISGAGDWRDGLLMIQRSDESGMAAGIDTDDEALAFIANKAHEGSDLHLKALALHCMPVAFADQEQALAS